MPLIRGQHSFDGRYAQIPNFMLRDKKLSLDTIGLLAQLMSHSPGWRVSQESLAKANNVGRDSIRRMIRELVEAGYLSVSEKQVHNEKGYLAGYTYTTKDPDAVTQEPSLVEPLLAEPTKADKAHKKTNNQEDNVKENNNLGKSTKPQLLNESWLPDDRLIGMFVTKWPLLNMSEQTEAFKLHHMAKGSKMADWGLAYQKWMNQAQKWAADKQGSVPSRKIVGDF
jgi:predicted transcriptional regulator